MKIVFSTKNVSRASFLDTCRLAYDYGFNGFEIYDAFALKKQHADSIFKSAQRIGAKRKLINRRIAVSALTQNGRDRIDDDGFTGTCFTGQHVKSTVKGNVRAFDDRDIFNMQKAQHMSLPFRT